MSEYRQRRPWRVRVGERFARYVADASDARTRCLRAVITQLLDGGVDVVMSTGLLPGLHFVFACDVTISALVYDDTIVLTDITEEVED